MKRADGTKFRQTTPEQLEVIRAHYRTKTSVELAVMLEMRIGTVKAIASRLGLRKNARRISEIRRDAVATRGLGEGSRTLGPHIALMLGLRAPSRIESAQPRVHRIRDDEEIAA